jgi:multidrug transporter EmrE-like cation transporter
MMIAVLIALNLAFSIVANVAFRLSAVSATWNDMFRWQLLGHLAGSVTVVALTCMLRNVPLGIAFPVTTGMSLLGVQIVAARGVFHEPINTMQWAGSVLIGLGLVLVQYR